MEGALLGTFIPLAYIICGIFTARKIYGKMRRVKVCNHGPGWGCSSYTCYNTDDVVPGTMATIFGGLFWPIAVMAIAVTWNPPKKPVELKRERDKAIRDLEEATRAMKAAKGEYFE